LRGDLNKILTEKNMEALVLYSESYKDANMFYLTKFLAPDPFIYIKKTDSKPIIIVSQMEYPRAKKQSVVKDVRSYSDYDYKSTVKTTTEPQLRVLQFIVKVLEKELEKGTKISVPSNFPIIVADTLRKEGLNITPLFGVVDKARETKSNHEIKNIQMIQEVNEKVTTEVIELIANSDVGKNKTLNFNGKPLTVRKIKTFFGKKFLENGILIEEDIIVACGKKSSDPHYVGEPGDRLKADQPIILDIYPRSIQKRYWTDMTRTIVKGKASYKLKQMFETVRMAKDVSFDALHAGAIASQVYNSCCTVIEKAGYEIAKSGKKVSSGMTHSLGHGVGLEIHENPRISEFSNFKLRERNVIAIEPGIYDPKIGGIRLEDIIKITKNGMTNLTKMETILEI
jgi:Xaa-Pro aminopeptidase